MRIALHQTTDVGTRAGRILLGERRLERLGLVGQHPRRGIDRRVTGVTDLVEFDVYVSDDLDEPEHHIEQALEAGISCVLWAAHGDLDDLESWHERFTSQGRTLLVGANLTTGLADCLAAYEATGSDTVLDVMCAWTEPGKPIRKGDALTFPDPVGARWGRPRRSEGSIRRFAAPIEGEWAGAMAKVTTGTTEGVIERTVGVADLGVHLEALALAAGAMTSNDYDYGLASPGDRPRPYLHAALDAGLDVATFTTEPATTEVFRQR